MNQQHVVDCCISSHATNRPVVHGVESTDLERRLATQWAPGLHVLRADGSHAQVRGQLIPSMSH